jgi:hypothetical protein
MQGPEAYNLKAISTRRKRRKMHHDIQFEGVQASGRRTTPVQRYKPGTKSMDVIIQA